MGDLTIGTKSVITQSGSDEPVLASTLTGSPALAVTNMTGDALCKVWVTYKGTDTVSKLDSYGVSTVSDNGTGKYTINFATAFANIYYCSVGMSGHNTTKLKSISQPIGTYIPTVNNCLYETVYSDNNLADAQIIHVAIFGDQ
jgi:hypothetical protein